MADYWIKLYHEILDDPKMAILSDRIWRRVIELFLMAGRLQKGGELPDANQIAWMLRISPDALESDLEKIIDTGIIERKDTGFVVCKFSKRQAAVPAKERMEQMRNRQHKQQYYGDDIPIVTDSLRNVTQITDTDTDHMHIDAQADNDVQKMVEQMTGYMALPSDIPAIKEMEKLGVVKEDIAGALEFFQRHNKTARGAANLLESVKFQVARRAQAEAVKGVKSNGNKSHAPETIRVDFGEGAEERTV
jgi:DNA-binding transcriptional regulator YhcF (GntR family)